MNVDDEDLGSPSISIYALSISIYAICIYLFICAIYAV